MPRKDLILNLSGFTLQRVSGHNPVILDITYRRLPRCAHCYSKQLRKKVSFIRLVRHESFGLRRTWLRFKAYKFYCRACHRYFNQRFDGSLKYQRSTEKLKKQVFHQHTQGISQRALAHDLQLGKSTVERWYQQLYVIKNKHRTNQACPKVLGIDKHTFSRRQGYLTTFCDLAKHRVFDIAQGKSAADLSTFLNTLTGKQHVKVVCIDLSQSYRYLIRHHFPNAMIVADRFHVIRLMNHYCMKTYHYLDPQLKYHRRLLGILRALPDKLSVSQRHRRDDYFKQQPVIARIYEFKQELHLLLKKKRCNARQCRELIPDFLMKLEQLKQMPHPPLQTLAKTLRQWQSESVRMWRFTKNNGSTEGFHRKMKLIQRRAYGFRNFENYRLRVRVLCS